MARMACLMHVVLCVWNLERQCSGPRVRKRERALGLAPPLHLNGESGRVLGAYAAVWWALTKLFCPYKAVCSTFSEQISRSATESLGNPRSSQSRTFLGLRAFERHRNYGLNEL